MYSDKIHICRLGRGRGFNGGAARGVEPRRVVGPVDGDARGGAARGGPGAALLGRGGRVLRRCLFLTQGGWGSGVGCWLPKLQ